MFGSPVCSKGFYYVCENGIAYVIDNKLIQFLYRCVDLLLVSKLSVLMSLYSC